MFLEKKVHTKTRSLSSLPQKFLNGAKDYITEAISKDGVSVVTGEWSKAMGFSSWAKDHVNMILALVGPFTSIAADIAEIQYIPRSGVDPETLANRYVSVSNTDIISAIHDAFKEYGLKHDDGGYSLLLTDTDGYIYEIDDLYECNLHLSDGLVPLLGVNYYSNMQGVDEYGVLMKYNPETEEVLITDCIYPINGYVGAQQNVDNTIFALLRRKNHLDDATTISQAAGFSSSTNLYNRVSSLSGTIYKELSDHIVYGPEAFNRSEHFQVWRSFFGILSSLLHLTTMVEICQYGIDLLSSGAFSIDQLRNKANSYVNKFKDFHIEIGDVIDEVIRVYNSQGAYYAMRCLVRYLQSSRDLKVVNGLLSFTDNDKYHTKVYLAGMIQGAITVASTLVSVIATVINPLIGAAVSAVGAIVTNISKLIIQKTESDRYADYDYLASGEMFPYGGCQFSYIGTTTNRTIMTLMRRNVPSNAPTMHTVPGAVVLASRARDITSGFISAHINSEVHLVPRTASLACLNNYISSTESIEHFYISGSQHDYYALIKDISVDKIVACYNSEEPLDIDGMRNLSNEDRDKLLRQSYKCALVYYTMYMLAMSKELNGGRSRSNALVGRVDSTSVLGNVFRCAYHDRPDWLPAWIDVLAGRGSLSSTMYMPLQAYMYRTGRYGSTELLNDFLGVDIDNLGGMDPDANLKLTFSFTTESLSGKEMIGLALDDPNTSRYEISGINGFSVVIPAYDSATYWLVQIAGMVAAALVATAVAITVVKVRMKVNEVNAINRAKAEQAWTNFTANPTSSNFTSYRKAARHNNLIASFTGGTVLNKCGYWDDPLTSGQDGTDSSFPDLGSIYSAITGSDL